MDFALFILLNALLLLRPEDLFPEIAGLRLYLITVVICTLATLPKLTYVLSPPQLARRPAGVCVLGMLVAAFLSFTFRGRVGEGVEFCGEFAKVVLYFFLLISLVDTPARLRAFMGWTVLLVLGSCCVAVSHFHGFYEFAGLDPVAQWHEDPDTGEITTVYRLISAGVFSDPNDLSVMIMMTVILAVGLLITSPSGLGRIFWILPVPMLFYTATLTQSRGGVLALLGGLAAWFYARFGVVRSLPLLVVAGTAVIAASARGGSITGGGTAHDRLMLWADGLGYLFRMPFHLVTGLAPGHYMAEHYHVAHNSYITGFVELGLLGGGFFLMAFVTAGWQTLVARPGGKPNPADWASELRPVVFAAVMTYAVGCGSLTRNFTLPTYLAIGIGAAYADLATPYTQPQFIVDGAWWKRLAMISVGGLVLAKFGTQLLGILGV